MAKFELKFLDCLFDDDFIKVQKITHHTTGLDCILISMKVNDEDAPYEILLDKSTSIKFAKTLRTEINKITESEGANG